MLNERSQALKALYMLLFIKKKNSRKSNLQNSKLDWCFPGSVSGDGECLPVETMGRLG